MNFLSEQSEGNPFFVGEYLRTAVAEGLLYRDAAGQWQVGTAGPEKATRQVYDALELPTSLRELVGRRLDGLSLGARQLVEAASVLGRDVNESVLQRLTGCKEGQQLEALAELLTRQVLAEPEAARLCFAHDKIREVAYEQLGAQRRQQLHRAAALAIEAQLGPTPDGQVAALAHHWAQAGEIQRARPYYLQAARQEARHHAHAEAERLFRTYLAHSTQPTIQSIEARNDLGREVLSATGRLDEAMIEHRQALDEARQLGDRHNEGISLFQLGCVHLRLSRFDEAAKLLELALQLARQDGQRQHEGFVLNSLANVHYGSGRVAQAQQLYQEALCIDRELDDREAVGVVLGNLANVHRVQGLMRQARSEYEASLRITRELQNGRAEVALLCNLSVVYLEQGQLAEAVDRGQEALDLARKREDPAGEAQALGALAGCYQVQGRIEQARAGREAASRLNRKLGNRRSEVIEIKELAELELAEGQTEQSRALFHRALAGAREMGNLLFEAAVLGGLADLERRTSGDLPAADQLARTAEGILSGIGHKLELAKLLCCRGHVALAGQRSALPFLQQVQHLVDGLEIGPDSDVCKRISLLRRSEQAFHEGRQLFRGEAVGDLP